MSKCTVRIVGKDDNRVTLRNLVGSHFTVPLADCEALAHKLLMANKIENKELRFGEFEKCLAGMAAESVYAKEASEKYVARERVQEIKVGTRLKLLSPSNLGLTRGLYDEGEIVKVIRQYGMHGWVIEGECYLLVQELYNPMYVRVLRDGEE